MTQQEKIFAAGLRYRRRAARLSKAAIARKIGVSRQMVTQWENGTSAPLATRLPGIAAELHCSIEELFTPEALPEDQVEDDADD